MCSSDLRMINEALVSGNALRSFENLITNHGGKIDVLKSDIQAKNMIPVMAKESGYVSEIDVNKIRMLARYLGAIRTTSEDKIDVGAGIVFNKKVGDEINNGGILGHIYTNNNTKIEKAVESLRDAYIITPKKVKKTPRVEFSM